MTVFDSLGHLEKSAGAELGNSRSIEISQSRIDAFADVTDDHQWIHTDVVRASSGPFGATVAHGFLTLSLAAPLLNDLLQVRGTTAAVNYGLNKVRFPAPVTAGATIYARGLLRDVVVRPGAVDAVVELTIHTSNSTKPACVAESIIRFAA